MMRHRSRWEPKDGALTPTGVSLPLVLVTLGLVVLTGCGRAPVESAKLSSLDPATTTVEYRFNDASVAPEYHRSYTLTAQAGEANIVIDSYGDILHDETARIDDATWQAVVESVAAVQIGASDGPDDCTGGTSHELLINEDNASPVLDIRVAVCGEQGQAEAAVIEAYVAPLLDLFDLETLLAPTD